MLRHFILEKIKLLGAVVGNNFPSEKNGKKHWTISGQQICKPSLNIPPLPIQALELLLLNWFISSTRSTFYTDLPGLKYSPRCKNITTYEHGIEVSSLGGLTGYVYICVTTLLFLLSHLQQTQTEISWEPSPLLCAVGWSSSELRKQILESGCGAQNTSKQISDSATKLKQQQLWEGSWQHHLEVYGLLPATLFSTHSNYLSLSPK